MNKRIWIMVLVAAGCVGDEQEKPEFDETKGVAGGKFEAWGAQDRPELFNPALEYKIAALPRQGSAAVTPWAGSYWPVAEDSINVRWNGASSESAAKKYERAFGGTGVENAVSQYHGIDAQTTRKA